MSSVPKIIECEPLKTLSEVLSWQAGKDWSESVFVLKSRSKYCHDGSNLTCHKNIHNPVKILNSSAPKTLLCHDMKGGYLDDRFVNGSLYHYQYLFNHWSAIDSFIYFSHHFITIPPLMWINSAHNNGVEILGTIITEYDVGKKIWDELFSDDTTMNSFISKLVEICNHYNFDGYLINIENKIDFCNLYKLTSFLKKLKSQLPTKSIIWYDSVSLLTGELKWQNELNEHNKRAFEICDGIFLNYNWKEDNLNNSRQRAGARQHDVYVGVDVFGRGCFGGGGFNTDKALQAVRSKTLSVAIFGFGWTHETQASDSKFFEIERKFWAKLWPYLYIHIPNSLPFETAFNQGVGTRQSTDPSEKSILLWYDLSFQQCQLSIPSCLNTISEKKNCISYCFEDGFSKGCCITLNKEKSEIEVHRLLLCDFSCSETTPVKLTVVSKWLEVYTPYILVLWVENELKNYTIFLQVSKDDKSNEAAGESLPLSSDYSCDVTLAKKIGSTKTVKFCENGWISNDFLLEIAGKITEIDVKLNEPISIGFLSLK